MEAKYIQKSFSRGILSPSVITRSNIKKYDEACKELFNIDVNRQGLASKRGGTAIIASESQSPSRIFPFYSEDRAYIIAIYSGEITDESSDELERTDNIRVYNITDFELAKKDPGFDRDDFLRSSRCFVYGTDVERNIRSFSSYWRDVEDGYDEDELLGADFEQLGNILIVTGESFPPFFIRKEGDRFVYYRNALDMVVNGNKENDQGSLKKAIRTLPFSYYGYGLFIDRTYNSRADGNVRFTGYLQLSDSYDSEGLAENKLDDWKNRAFIISTIGEFGTEVRVYNGIIKDVCIDNSGGNPSKYRVSGFLHTPNQSEVEREQLNFGNNLYLCDWSERLGFPRSVAIYENRICYFSNKAFPAKLWFSAQPGIQRVQVGNKEEISVATETQAEVRTLSPILQTLYFDQLDLFNVDVHVTGLLPQQASSSGSYFINDNKGFTGYWIKAGKVLFIGTSEGLFISRGTDISNNNPIPFNTGFTKPLSNPVKRVFPELVDESLYFISEDNTVQRVVYNRSQNDFVTESLDSFSKDVIRDTSVRKTITRNISVSNIIVNETIDESNPNIVNKRNTLNFHNPVGVAFGETLDRSRGTMREYYRSAYVRVLKEIDGNVSGLNTLLYRAGISHLYGFFSSLISRSDAENVISNAIDVSNNPSYSFSPDFYPVVFSSVYDYRRRNFDDEAGATIYGTFLKRKGVSAPNISGSLRLEDRRRTDEYGITDVIGVDTYLKGTLDSGYLSSNKLGYPSLSAPRLCGADRLGVNSLRLYFNKAQTGIENVLISNLPKATQVSDINDVSANSIYYKGGLGNIAGTINDSDEFGREEQNVHYIDIVLTGDLSEHSNNIKITAYDDDNNIQGETNLTLEDDNGYKMRDNLLNPISGEYEVYSFTKVLKIVYEDDGDTVPRIASAEEIRNSYNQNEELDGTGIQDIFRQVEIIYGDPLAMEEEEEPDTPAPEPLTVSEEILVPFQYDVFNSNTRLLFDWTTRSLYLFRKDQNYLRYALDQETDVRAWTRGRTNFKDALFLKTLPHKPPEIFPAIFGIENKNLLMMTKTIAEKTDRYIDNLANCLDEHVVVEKNGESIDLEELKESLKSVGYGDRDLITIWAEGGSVMRNVRVSDLRGNIRGVKGDSFIVGKPYNFNIVTWHPFVENRSIGKLTGNPFKITQLAFNIIHKADILINGKKGLYDDDKDINSDFSTLFSKMTAVSSKGFDPSLKITSDHPEPFSIGGFVANLDVGGK